MEKFIIEGGAKLSGIVRPNGNKNEALPILAATLLTDEPVILRNVPKISDVLIMLKILEDLGVDISYGEKEISICARNIRKNVLDAKMCQEIRASILFAGPMLARCGGVVLPPPGGDVIGRRRIDTHIHGFMSLGAGSSLGAVFELRGGKLEGADIFMDEASVTATENIIMAASMSKGETIIRNAACEPHVQGLCRILNKMGANIEGIGTNTLKIFGVDSLKGCEYTIGPDYLEVGSFIGLAAITGSHLIIKNAGVENLRMIRMTFNKLGIHFDVENDDVIVPGDQSIRIRYDLYGAIPKIDDAPWPNFPTDLMSIAIVIATQGEGTVLFFEKMFDGRMFFIDNLIAMGAKIILCDPHRVVVVGPSKLYGTSLKSPDIRAGMAVLIASLCAEGTSEIHNIRQIDRGYERIDDKLRSIGAKIERVDV
jgi:UDP-N-acetylglucosamine 1-carboxyvinyltransferase